MEAGKLRHRITIEAPTAGQNQFGEPIDAWSEYATVAASREDLAGREGFAAQQVYAQVVTRFTTRFLLGVTAKMRLTSDGITYNILSAADPDGRARSLIILASREG